MAEDAAKVAPHVYKVLFENEPGPRASRAPSEPGSRTEQHAHRTALSRLTLGKARFTTAVGAT